MISVHTLETNCVYFKSSFQILVTLTYVGFIFCADYTFCWKFNFVPYMIWPGFSIEQEKYIKNEVGKINNRTCIYWGDIKDSPGLRNISGYVRFVKATENITCETLTYLPTATTPLRVKILLSDICFHGRAVLHEMLHALGFDHEHQRLDRDCYVMLSDTAKTNGNYRIKRRKYNHNMDRFPYDKQSVMHYPRSTDMKARSERWYQNEPLGNREERLTDIDLWKIQYRFCGRLHYCDVYHQHCTEMDKMESEKNCTVKV